MWFYSNMDTICLHINRNDLQEMHVLNVEHVWSAKPRQDIHSIVKIAEHTGPPCCISTPESFVERMALQKLLSPTGQ